MSSGTIRASANTLRLPWEMAPRLPRRPPLYVIFMAILTMAYLSVEAPFAALVVLVHAAVVRAASVGLTEPGLNGVIRTGYKILDLITFFTAGKPEVRAWTIHRGTKAPQAAGKIHTDFERGFIKAEVIWWEDLVTLKSEAAVKAVGKMGTEGKEYVVRDGDTMHFRFNV